jgi:ATP-binding cassette subfamily B protein
LHPDKGTIKIDGADLSACSTVSIREAIGIVHQESFTFDGTIRMNLALARSDASEQEMLEACENALLGDYIRSQEKGLDTVIGKNGVAMSGGEKQRLSIARLFLRNPKILIMDEATSALDHQAEHAINQAWKRLADGRTCIIIAHRLSTVLNADKVVVLSEGRVVDYDTHENLYRNSDIYKRLFRDQYRQGGAAFESI